MKREKKLVLMSALLIAACMFTGCGQSNVSSVQPIDEPITLKGVTIGKEPENMEDIYAALDIMTLADLGCRVRLDFISWGAEKTQLMMALSSGEYDFLPAGNFSDYQTMAQKNAYVDLNTLLDLVPDLVAHYQDAGADALVQCEINGGLYGIPQYGMPGISGGYSEGFFYREDLRKAWGLEPITDLNSMEAYLYRAKTDPQYADVPLITDNRIWRSLWLMLSKGRYLEVTSSIDTIPYLVVDVQNPTIVLNRFETPEMQQLVNYVTKWYRDGIIDPQILGASNNETERAKNLLLADKKPCETNIPIWVVSPKIIPDMYEQHPEWEWGFFAYNRNDEHYFATSMYENTVIAITQKSLNKELTIRLLEKLHTDESYYLLMTSGLEGVNYYLKDGVLSKAGISSDLLFTGITGLADTHYDYSAESVDPQWQAVQDALNQETEGILKNNVLLTSPVMGFTIDWTGMEDLHDQLYEVYVGHLFPLLCGTGEEGSQALEAANTLLYSVGLQSLMDNVSSQLRTYIQPSRAR